MSQQVIRTINTTETPLGFAVKRSTDGYYLSSLPNTFSASSTLTSPFPLIQLTGYKSTVFRYALDTTNLQQGDYVAYIISSGTLSVKDIQGFTV